MFGNLFPAYLVILIVLEFRIDEDVTEQIGHVWKCFSSLSGDAHSTRIDEDVTEQIGHVWQCFSSLSGDTHSNRIDEDVTEQEVTWRWVGGMCSNWCWYPPNFALKEQMV